MSNTKEWKQFNLNKLFDIKAGKYYYSHEYEEGETPYVSASNVNNGITQRINLSPDFEGNCIVTGKVGCTAFYQSEPFCATSDVNIFTAKHFKMNRKIGLFIVTVINYSENYKWNYGRQCRIGDSKKINIFLPAVNKNGDYKIDENKIFSDEGYIPDFEYIQHYMDKVEEKKIEGTKSIKESVKTKNKLRINKKIDFSSWKEFKLKDLFTDIYKSHAHIKANMLIAPKGSRSDKCITFVSRTEFDNGSDGLVLNNDLKYVEPGNAITIGDTTATTYYQGKKFITGDHIVVCRAEWINPFTALFIKTIIDLERYKYSYGRAFKMDTIKNTIIKLPVNELGKPDFIYMENYILSLPYGDKI